MFAHAFLEAMILRLVRLFLDSSDGDNQRARQAAHTALLALQPRSEAELMLAAEAISFSLHALDALTRSMEPDLSISQLCRVRSNAVSMSREAHKAQRKLDQLRKADPPEAAAHQGAEPTLTAKPTSRLPGQTWTQAYHQRQRDKRLAEKERKRMMRNGAVLPGHLAVVDAIAVPPS